MIQADPGPTPHPSPSQMSRRDAIMVVAAFFLTLGNFAVTLNNASVEPYEAFRRSDAVVQVGGSSTLVVAWCAWIVALIATMLMRRRFNVTSLLLIMWGVACMFGAIECMDAYFHDLEEFVLPALRP